MLSLIPAVAVDLTNMARSGDLIEGLEQVTAQCLDIGKMVLRGVRDGHQDVQVNRVVLGPLDAHVE